MSLEEITKLDNLFYDPKQGLVSLDKLKQKAKEQKIKLTHQQIEHYYDHQPVNHIMKPIRKPQAFSSYVANYPGHIYQMDIIVYTKYKFHNYQYILVVVDIYSRFVIAKAMTNRRIETSCNAFEEIIKEFGQPFKLQCDNEFNKTEFIKLLEKNGIRARFSDPNENNKNPIVERVNATLEILLQKARIVLQRHDWYNYLNDCVFNYNTTEHSTTHHKPVDIFLGNVPNDQDIIDVKYKFSIGDKVKIISDKKIFDKIDVVKMSNQTYVIESIKGERIKLYGVDKTYKPYEIKKVFTVDDTNNNQNYHLPTDEYIEHKKDLALKRVGVEKDNIITTKRTHKPNPKYE